MLGKGDGTFLPSTTLSIASSPIAFARGDFSHDGNADLAVTSELSVVRSCLETAKACRWKHCMLTALLAFHVGYSNDLAGRHLLILAIDFPVDFVTPSV
jgi:hypothetical protein